MFDMRNVLDTALAYASLIPSKYDEYKSIEEGKIEFGKAKAKQSYAKAKAKRKSKRKKK